MPTGSISCHTSYSPCVTVCTRADISKQHAHSKALSGGGGSDQDLTYTRGQERERDAELNDKRSESPCCPAEVGAMVLRSHPHELQIDNVKKKKYTKKTKANKRREQRWRRLRSGTQGAQTDEAGNNNNKRPVRYIQVTPPSWLSIFVVCSAVFLLILVVVVVRPLVSQALS